MSRMSNRDENEKRRRLAKMIQRCKRGPFCNAAWKRGYIWGYLIADMPSERTYEQVERIRQLGRGRYW